MSYLIQSRLAGDQTIIARASACAATQLIPNPQGWAFAQSWQLSAQPGWVEAYASALASDDPDPGGNEAVTTDGMILAAVTAIRDNESPAE